jgi:hypothetical protein
LHIYQEIEVHKLTKGENHKYRAMIENAGILPIHNMRLGIYSGRCSLYEIEDGKKLSMYIHEKKELLSDINCRFAGAYEVGIEKITFTDPFNIFDMEFEIPYSFRAIVSPRITDAADPWLDIENLINVAGLKSERLWEEIPGSDLKVYEKGDPISSINWKVSARLSEPVVRIPDKMETRKVALLLDAVDVPEREQDEEFLSKRDIFLELVVSCAWHFGKQGVPIKIVYPSGKIRESLVDSYESFMEFYNIVADGIFYSSQETVDEIEKLVNTRRSGAYDADTWIIITEAPKQGEDNFIICP